MHVACLQYLRAVMPRALIHHSANELNMGGDRVRNARVQARSKRLGMMPGWPDLVVLTPSDGVIFFEVKAPGGSLSPDQRAMRETIERLGYPYAVVRSVEDVRAALAGWGVTTLETA